MLKSLEMKTEIKSLREEIQALIDQKEAVPVEMQNKLQDALSDYEKQLEVEAAAKNSKNKGENNMDKKSFNAALKSYLLGIKNEDTAKFFNTATGQNGAVDADGGVLIPSELLDLKENNGINNDLRSLTTAIAVGTRSDHRLFSDCNVDRFRRKQRDRGGEGRIHLHQVQLGI